MKIKHLRADLIDILSDLYGSEEVLSFFYILSEKFLGLRRVDVALHLEKNITEEELHRFIEARKRLENQDPIQYIVGDTYFYGLRFQVNQYVLIPRPETEELVDWIVKDCENYSKEKRLKILDIGTGSGCIAVSLAKHLPQAEIFAMDVSEKALEIAKLNAEHNQAQVRFMLANVLELEVLKNDFDIIVSNPPYVRMLEKREMQPNVLEHEPHLALFVSDQDPLVFYNKITGLAKKNLKKGGVLYFEINQYLGNETADLIKKYGFSDIQLRKDLYNNDRMIRADF